MPTETGTWHERQAASDDLKHRLPEVTAGELASLQTTLGTLHLAALMNRAGREEAQLDANVLIDAFRAALLILKREGSDTHALMRSYNGIRADLADAAQLAFVYADIDEVAPERVRYIDAAGHGLLAVARNSILPDSAKAANLERLRIFHDAADRRLEELRPKPHWAVRNATAITAVILAALLCVLSKCDKSGAPANKQPSAPMNAPDHPDVPGPQLRQQEAPEKQPEDNRPQPRRRIVIHQGEAIV